MLQVPQRHYNRRLITRHNRQNIRAISTSSLQTTISNSSTSLKRLSLPSQQKITKRTKLDITSTSSNSTSNVSMDGCTTLQNQVLFSLMCKTNCEGCGNRWSGTMDINKREDLFLILSFQCSSCTNTITIGALAIKKSNSAKYNDVIRSHQCEKNYEKNFDTIEADAVLNMFKQSVSEYGVYYTKYVGDGDSKTFSLLSKTIP
ncbi:unnamed protein product [Rotaria sp. Silwood2]|nr:unnamed protein product [Rotaria sp. Silwood2]